MAWSTERLSFRFGVVYQFRGWTWGASTIVGHVGYT